MVAPLPTPRASLSAARTAMRRRPAAAVALLLLLPTLGAAAALLRVSSPGGLGGGRGWGRRPPGAAPPTPPLPPPTADAAAAATARTAAAVALAVAEAGGGGTAPPPDGGDAASSAGGGGLAGWDCAALGRRAEPAWVDRPAAAASIPAFLALYARRQVADNAGGMRADHSFGLYTAVRALRPRVFIESGVFKAHASWLVTAVAPGTKIISMDPSAASCDAARRGMQAAGGDPDADLTCMTGRAFVDFGAVDWDAVLPGTDPVAARAATLVLVDDHQAGPRRLMEAALRGFTHTLFDDNYGPSMKGDIYSVKQACARGEPYRAGWAGELPDRFSTVRARGIPWARHVAAGDAMAALMEEYYEFPPLGAFALSGQTRVAAGETAPPLVTSREAWEGLGLADLPAAEYAGHTHIAYVRLRG